MAQIEEIIKAIDNKLLETGKEHLILQQASKLLLSLGIIESSKELKHILENGEIPHAYKTDTAPKQWILPLSEEGKNRKNKLNKKSSKRPSRKTKNKNQDSDDGVFHCTICGYTAMIPEQFRSDQYLTCPICKTNYINTLYKEIIDKANKVKKTRKSVKNIKKFLLTFCIIAICIGIFYKRQSVQKKNELNLERQMQEQLVKLYGEGALKAAKRFTLRDSLEWLMQQEKRFKEQIHNKKPDTILYIKNNENDSTPIDIYHF